jgi:hypothetical protein
LETPLNIFSKGRFLFVLFIESIKFIKILYKIIAINYGGLDIQMNWPWAANKTGENMIRVLTIAFMMSVFATPAYAYIDAAIGSMVLQAVIAGFFAFMVMWRGWMMRIKNFFNGKGFTLDFDEDELSETAKEE